MSGRLGMLALGAYAIGAVVVALWLLNSSAAAVAGDLSPSGEVRLAEDTGRREVVIDEGMSGDAIASLLRDQGVIEDDRRFRLLLRHSGAGAELQSGCYELRSVTPAAEALARLRAGDTTERVLSIPEGLRLEEVGERVVQAGVATRAQWESALAQVQSEAGPAGRPADADLLGYLMPAAYPIECDTTALSLVESMVETFSSDVSPELIAEAEAQGLGLHDVLTLASIVEREAGVAEERPVIASVFRNRLKAEMPLAADPTVQFAIADADSVAQYGWWKQALTLDDLAVDSPYNTYVRAGLPPGPIANPGLDAIEAAIRPADTPYLFFVARGDGTHVFSETFEEHSANVERYQGGGG